MAKVMIVEDEFIIQDELKIILEEMGHTVVATASTAEKAINNAEIQNPEIILMDIRLSGKQDGIEAAKVIKERFDIPVIFITAYTDEERVERAKLTHPYGYLIKPIQERDLKVTIEMALYAAKMDAEKRQAEEEREKLIAELQDALDKVKTLEGMLPICASCKKIKDDKGYWNQLETYIESRSEALFSHGICPECLETLYPKTHEKLKKKGEL